MYNNPHWDNTLLIIANVSKMFSQNNKFEITSIKCHLNKYLFDKIGCIEIIKLVLL